MFHFLNWDFFLIVAPIRLSCHEDMQGRQPLGVGIESFKVQAGGAFYEKKSRIHGHVSVSSSVMGPGAQGKRT